MNDGQANRRKYIRVVRSSFQNTPEYMWSLLTRLVAERAITASVSRTTVVPGKFRDLREAVGRVSHWSVTAGG
jgi:hypothetical protein